MSEFKTLFTNNPRLLFTETTVRNALKDIYQTDTGRINVLVMAYNSIDILNEIKKDHSNLSVEKQKWIKKLQTEYCVRQEMAVEAVNTWAELFAKATLKKLTAEYEEYLKKTEEQKKNEQRSSVFVHDFPAFDQMSQSGERIFLAAGDLSKRFHIVSVPMKETDIRNISGTMNRFGSKWLPKTDDDAWTDQQDISEITTSASRTDRFKLIIRFFSNITDINEALSGVISSAAEPNNSKYSVLQTATDLYSYISLALESELTDDPSMQNTRDHYKGSESSATEILTIVSQLMKKHENGGGFVSLLHALEKTISEKVFINQETKSIYDIYLQLQKSGMSGKVERMRDVPNKIMDTLQLSDDILLSLQSMFYLSNQEAVLLYQQLTNGEISAEQTEIISDKTSVTCRECGAIARLSEDQLKNFTQKRIHPLCPVCRSPLFTICPICKKPMPGVSTSHGCGWSIAYDGAINKLKQALNAYDFAKAIEIIDRLDKLGKRTPETEKLYKKALTQRKDFQAGIAFLKRSIAEKRIIESKRKADELKKLYPPYPELLELCNSLENELIVQEKVKIKKNIQALLDKGRLTEADDLIDNSRHYDFDQELNAFRANIRKKQREIVLTKYSEDIQKALQEDRPDEAEAIVSSAVKDGFQDVLRYSEQINEKKKQLEETARTLLEDKAYSYHEGIKTAVGLLDRHAGTLQAKIWLQNHPRVEKVSNPNLSFKDGSRSCTMSWEDDDPYTVYTVCRKEDGYPSDPGDGYTVCKEVLNKTVTDDLTNAVPGTQLYYSVFAVRIPDGQWIKTDFPGEAIWLPEPQDVQISVNVNDRGRKMISVSWDTLPAGSSGVSISRYSDDDGYAFSESVVEPDDADVQNRCRFDDTDILPRTKYRYLVSQIWHTGIRKRSSTAVRREITVD